MPKTIDYFFTPVSPWTYLGHDRLLAIAAKRGATVAPKLVDLGQGLPDLRRPAAAEAGAAAAGLPADRNSRAGAITSASRINFQPKFGAASGDPGCRWILAAREHGAQPALALAGAIMRARWAEERDIADEATLAAIAAALGQDAGALAARAATPEIAAAYEADTREAIDRQVFGAPTYVYRDELFWGQDRLDFLDRKLAQ